MNLLGGQLALLRWHHVGFAVLDNIDDCSFAPAMQPVVVGQVGSAQCLVALAGYAMARCSGRVSRLTAECLDLVVRTL